MRLANPLLSLAALPAVFWLMVVPSRSGAG